MNKMTRYTLFFLLYFAEGSILGYFTALNAVYLLCFNNNMSQIGLLGTIAMLPFILKIFLGMLSDKVNLMGLGYRKPYIVTGLLIQALCLVVITMVNPGRQFWLYGLVAFILQLGMALFDTCHPGFAQLVGSALAAFNLQERGKGAIRDLNI
jgi:MFS transporter, PAT family, beta-lactamase induction signal transducer AmpG